MFFVYVLYSELTDTFYIGETEELERRIIEHNEGRFQNSFTKKATDWKLYLSINCKDRVQARKLELHIKRMKSRKYIQNLNRYPDMVARLLEIYS